MDPEASLARKKRLVDVFVLYVLIILAVGFVAPNSIGLSSVVSGVALALLVEDDLRKLRAWGLQWGKFRWAYPLSTLVFPAVTLVYLWRRRVHLSK